MRPRNPILLCCFDEFQSGQLKLVLETRLPVKVAVATGMGAVKGHDFHCAILTHGAIAVIDFLRARGIPTLEIGKSPSYADRVVSGEHMMDILEAVRIMCVGKRGPKKVAA